MSRTDLEKKLSLNSNPPYTFLDMLTSSFGEGELEVTTDIPKQQSLSMAVLILIIVASLSLVVGAIYLLIYFKSIKPMSARSRSYVDQGGKPDDDVGRSKSAHPFFRRK